MDEKLVTQKMVDKEVNSLPGLFGTTEFGLAIGWIRQKVSIYNSRGKLPTPATHIANRPYWTKMQVYKFAQENGITLKEDK